MVKQKKAKATSSNSSSVEEQEDLLQTDSMIKEDNDAEVKARVPFNSQKNKILEKYENIKGRRLFLRFPKKLPQNPEELDTKVKSLSKLIVKVCKFRQKCARSCLVDFDSEDDRAKALEELKKVEIDGKKLVVSLPKIENEKFLEKLVQKAEDSAKRRTAKLKMKKKAKKAAALAAKEEEQETQKVFTSVLVVDNIPRNVTMSEMYSLFPSAMEITWAKNTGFEKMKAYVKMPTPKEASILQRKGAESHGEKLQIKFAKPVIPKPGGLLRIRSHENQPENMEVNEVESESKDEGPGSDVLENKKKKFQKTTGAGPGKVTKKVNPNSVRKSNRYRKTKQ